MRDYQKKRHSTIHRETYYTLEESTETSGHATFWADFFDHIDYGKYKNSTDAVNEREGKNVGTLPK